MSLLWAEEEHFLILNTSFCLGRCLSFLSRLGKALWIWCHSSCHGCVSRFLLPVLLGSRFLSCIWQFVKPHAVGAWALRKGHPRYSHRDLLSLTHLPPPLKLIGRRYFLMEVPSPFRHFITSGSLPLFHLDHSQLGEKSHKSYLIIRIIFFFFQKVFPLFTPSAFHIYSESSWIAFVSTNMSSVF